MTDLLGELDARSDEWEALVDASSGIDPWCSGPDWVIPVHRGFGNETDPTLLDCGTAGWAMLARYEDEESNGLLSGLEPMWGFACPIIGPEPAVVAQHLCRYLKGRADWDRVILPGFPRDAELARTVGMQLIGLGRVGLAEGIVRQQADLSEGFETWWERRPAKLRRNLRNARRRGEEAGLHIIEPALDDTLFHRVLAIEHRSWKGKEESGITSPEMSTFYEAMLGRLATAGRLRAHVATLDPGDPAADVGFIIGGVRGERYRGLQLSYTDEAAALSVSHLLQLHQIEALTSAERDDEVMLYDLGMDMDYKRRWADEDDATLILVIDRT